MSERHWYEPHDAPDDRYWRSFWHAVTVTVAGGLAGMLIIWAVASR